MTLAHKILRSREHLSARGFTLLEMMVTMAIVAIILGSALMYTSRNGSGELQKVAQQSQILAKKTHALAKADERPYSIYITANRIWSQREGADSTPPAATDTSQTSNATTLEIPEDVQVSVLPAYSKDWIHLGKNTAPFIWAFSQSGLCESIEIRFENELSLQTLNFHPLTAGEIIHEN